MGTDTKIEWCHHSANFWWGCVEVSPGCDHCYARELAKRFGREVWGVHAPRFLTKSVWNEVPRWQREAKASGVRRRVFCQSMSDIGEILPSGHPQCIDIGIARHRVFTELIPATPDLDWLLLTKRIGNMEHLVPEAWLEGGWPSNVRMGISVVNQEEADRDIPKLLRLPAPERFLSYEPALGPIDFYSLSDQWALRSYLPWQNTPILHGIHWIIVGGESGAKARPFNPEWALSLIDQCKAAGVPVFVKQVGSQPMGSALDCLTGWISKLDRKGGNWEQWPEALRVRELPEVRA